MSRTCIVVLLVGLGARVLAQPADPDTSARLLSVLQAGQPERMSAEEWNALRRLLFLGVSESPGDAEPFVPFLREALRDTDAGVATSAAAALLSVEPSAGGAEAAAVLVSGLQSPDEEVRGDTRNALSNLTHITPELVPAYRAAVRADIEYKWALAEALAKVPASLVGDVLEPLVELLNDPDPRTRSAAARTLGGYGLRAVRAQPALRRLLVESDDPLERVEAAAALVETQRPPDPALLTVLIDALRAPSRDARWQALQTAKAWGPSAAAIVPGATARLEDEESSVRWAAANLLGHIGPPAAAALPALRALADRDRQWNTGTEAKIAIRLIENKPEIDWSRIQPRGVLLRALASSDTRERLSAVQQLDRRGVDKAWARPLARTALRDGDAAIRYQAAYVLATLDPPSGPALIPTFREMLRGTVVINGSNPKILANIALGELGRAGLDVLIEALTALDEDTRVNAVHGLMYADELPLDAEKALLEVLHDRSDLVRHQALAALVTRKAAPKQMVPMLIQWLGDGSASTRVEAARGLGLYGPDAIAAVPALRAVMRDSDPEVAAASAASLAAVDPSSAVDLLPGFIARFTAALRDASSGAEGRLVDAAYALGGLGTAAREAMPALLDAFGQTEGKAQVVIGVSAIRVDPVAGAPVLQAFIDALAAEDTRDAALWAFKTLGPLAASAEAAVSKVANDPDALLHEEAVEVLAAIRRR